jgi:ATP-dependent helicase/nuclease subunit B
VNALLLGPGENLIDAVAGRIGESGVALSDAIVVFPGKRPAHFLRQRLAEGRTAGFLPPRILSMDQLVDAAFEARQARADRVLPKAEAIDAVALLYEIQLEAERPLGGTAFMTLDSFLPLGLKIHRDLEELAIERVPARKVAEVQALIEEEVPERSRERLLALSWFYERFYPKVAESNLSTRSSRYVEVAGGIEPGDLGSFQLLIFAGFSTLTKAERDLFARAAVWPRSLFIFQDGPGMRAKLTSLGVRHPAVSATAGAAGDLSSAARRPEVRLSSSPDAHGQVFALNAALDRPDGETVIVLPSPDTLFPLLRHCLSRFDEESYNVSLGYPLQRTPLFGFLSNLMELVGSMDGERLYLPSYISFVLHPYTKNVRFRGSAESTRVLFHVLEERLAAARTRRFATLEEIESNEGPFEGLFEETARRIADEEDSAAVAEELRAHLRLIHSRTISAFLFFPTIRAFAERVIQLISWVHEASTARDHPTFTPISESFLQTLESISRSLMASMAFSDTAGYFALLRRYLQTCYHPFPGTPLHGMQVLGALETRNLRFDRVFVLDANEGVLPESGAESTLLPFAVRQALELSTSQDQEQIAAYHFALLKAGARELHLFSVESGEKERSRFAERLLWEMQQEQATIDGPRLVRPIQYRVSLEARPPAPVEKTAAVAVWLALREYSATALDTYLRCPLAFYQKYVLNLGKREESSAGVEPADIGTFVHEVLFQYFKSRTGRPLGAGDADRVAMAALVDELFAEKFGPAETGANRLLRNQIRSHLGDFTADYLRGLFQSHRVEMRALELDVTASREGFALRGRIDAVQERDGKPCLIDYKTSANRASYALRLDSLDVEDRSTWSTAVKTLQLPFYVLLYSAEKGIPMGDVRAMFLLLGRTRLDEGIELHLFAGEGAPADAWPRLESVIFGLLREIVSPDVPFAPAADPKTACAYCDFTGICGTGWRAI